MVCLPVVPAQHLYCATLWQCTVTVIRYGLIGDIFDVRRTHARTHARKPCTCCTQQLTPPATVCITYRHAVRAGFKGVEALDGIIIRGPYPPSNAIIYVHLQL